MCSNLGRFFSCTKVPKEADEKQQRVEQIVQQQQQQQQQLQQQLHQLQQQQLQQQQQQLQQQEYEREQHLQLQLHNPNLSRRQQLMALSSLNAMALPFCRQRSLRPLAPSPSLPIRMSRIIRLREQSNPNCECNCHLYEAVDESSDDQAVKEEEIDEV